MKINSLEWLAKQSKPSMTKPFPDDFSHWLSDECLAKTTTEQQSSGNEYYRQHQDQLQQSSLHFEAHPEEAQPYECPSIRHKSAVEPNEASSNQQPEPCSPPTQHRLTPETSTSSTYSAKVVSLITEIGQALEQSIGTPEVGAKVQTPAEVKSCPQPTQIKNTGLSEYAYKNNHVFIQDGGVELTLNLQQLNKQDQQQLIHLLHEHLKKKGLILSRLIINGVTYD